MNKLTLFAAFFSAMTLLAQTADNLVVEGVPEIPAELRQEVGRYLEFRAAAVNDWHPKRREILITTRFAEAAQLHHVAFPGGARRQLTFLPEPVGGGRFQPVHGKYIVFSQDRGGGEFYQLYRYDLADGKITLLTDGKSRNTDPNWGRSGRWLAYTSTARNGKDNDIYRIDPLQPEQRTMVLQVEGGGWRIEDWSHSETQLLLSEYISINQSHLHLLDLKTGRLRKITPAGGEKVAWANARFSRNNEAVYATSDAESEFQRIVQLDLQTGKSTPVTPGLKWDVDEFELSPDGRTIAFVTNEDGISVLHWIDARSGKEKALPRLPVGLISGLKWHENNRDLAFSLSSARSTTDAYSIDLKNGRLERWTTSETGGLNPESFVEPELVRTKSFDGLEVTAFLYRPDAQKFPGKRPVIVSIHGGPESQFRPGFQARNNYYLNELGVALLVPNVRGSSGYGKTFLTLDNGFKREDSVRDIGAFLDWIGRSHGLDAERVAVMGGSYGGYMVLASMVHYNERLRAGVDVVGISNFLTFLKNTQDYRRDLRRVEYGDERDPKMAEFLEKISPTTNVKKITKPLFVVQGKNDPRVPVTEAEQMVHAVRSNGGPVWYLMAKDEGHGFAKKKNADYQFLATILFYKQHLLANGGSPSPAP